MNRKSPHGVSQNVVKREIPGNTEDKYTAASGSQSESEKGNFKGLWWGEDMALWTGEEGGYAARKRERNELKGNG